MAVEHLIKRTIYVAKCDCGVEPDVKTDNTVRERLCSCGKWKTYEEQSAIGPSLGKP